MTIFSDKSYLEKHRFAKRQISSPPAPDLFLVVVIPSHCEPELLSTLDSLEACEAPAHGVEVIVVFNSSEKASAELKQQNAESLQAARRWQHSQKRKFAYHFLHFPDLPRKHAGVGLARKIGMDEAVDRLERAERPEGVIVCLDADSMVVPNYLQEIERSFLKESKRTACSIHFEHPIHGDAFSSAVYEGIVRYELYLRYYIEGLRHAGYPHAFHTIGSSMAVRSRAYQSESGMNRRKAGEDFYFLHKFIPNPGFFELNSTCVIPSPRPAEKVPFGTGKAIVKWLESGARFYPAFDPRSFFQLKGFLEQVPSLYASPPPPLPTAIQAFLDQEDFLAQLEDIRAHVGSLAAFSKRFFRWFHPLKVLQYMHFARDRFWQDVEVGEAVKKFSEKTDLDLSTASRHKEILISLRERQKNGYNALPGT